jgi:hypothetical protein
MAPARLRSTAAACAAALLCGLALGCGEEPGVDEPAREGLAIDVSGVDYNVFITRELNLAITPDKDYYPGPEAGPGNALYGIFVEACNPGSKSVRTTGDFTVKDNQGNEYKPMRLPEDNAFAYRPTELAGEACMPEDGSVAQQGPTAGSMLLFEFPLENTENRPLELEIGGPFDLLKQDQEIKTVELDL